MTIVGPLYPQGPGPQISRFKNAILNASSEQEKLEGIINISTAYSNLRSDSVSYYLDLLDAEEYSDSELAKAGKFFITGLRFYRDRNFKEAISNFELSAENFENNVAPNIYLNNLNMLAISYLRINKPNEAILIFEKIIERSDELNIQQYLASAYANMANAYKRLKKFADAIIYSEKSIANSTSNRLAASSTFAYMNLAQMLTTLELYERSLEAFDLALGQNMIAGEQVTVSLLAGKGIAFRRMDKLDSAIANFKKAIDIGSENNFDHLLMMPNLELTGIYLGRGQLARASESVNTALSYCGVRCAPQAKIQLYIYRILVAKEKKEYDEAIRLSNEFENLINQQKIGHLSKDGFQIVASVYEEIGDSDNGLKYQKIYNELNFGTIALAQRARLAEERVRLEVLESEGALEDEQSSTAFYRSLIFKIAILAVLLILGLGVLFRYYKREKQDGSLKNNELETLKEQLTQLSNLQSDLTLDYITLKSKAVINLEKLKYVKSDGPYLELFLTDKQNPEIDRNTLKQILAELPPHRFIQVHRSSIVNLNFVKAIYSNKLVLKDGQELSISRSFKSEVDGLLKATA